MKHRVAFLDVFAERPLAGNGLAVVDDADGVSDEVMLAFARETRLSETTFVQAPTRTAPTTATASGPRARSCPSPGTPRSGPRSRSRAGAGSRRPSFVQQTRAGLQPIEVRGTARPPGAPSAGAPRCCRRRPSSATSWTPRRRCARSAWSRPTPTPSCRRRSSPPACRTRSRPLADAGSLERVQPDYPAIDELLAPHGAVVLYLAWVDPGTGEGRARGFSRIVALGEDPATGSAVGPALRLPGRAHRPERDHGHPGRGDGAPERAPAPRWRGTWPASAAPRSR